MQPFTRCLKYIIKGIEWAGILLMIGMSVITFIQVIYRYVFKGSFFWAEEFAIMSMIYVTFLGATLAVGKGTHTRIDFLINRFKYKRYIEALNHIICAAFLAYLGYSSLPIIQTTRVQNTIAMQIPRSMYYYGILIGCILMILYLLVLAYCKITNLNFESGEYE